MKDFGNWAYEHRQTLALLLFLSPFIVPFLNGLLMQPGMEYVNQTFAQYTQPEQIIQTGQVVTLVNGVRCHWGGPGTTVLAEFAKVCMQQLQVAR